MLITEICSTTHSFKKFKDKATKGCGQILTDFCHKHVPCGSRLFDMELIQLPDQHHYSLPRRDLAIVHEFKEATPDQLSDSMLRFGKTAKDVLKNMPRKKKKQLKKGFENIGF